MFRKRIHRLIILLCLSTLLLAFSYRKNIRKWNYFRYVQNHLSIYQKSEKPKAGEVIANLPMQLKPLPLSDDLGIVISAKKVSIRNVSNSYNASLIENPLGGFLLFFRFDCDSKSSKIGLATLDDAFQQTENEVDFLDTHQQTSEDARIFKKENDFYLVYNEKDEKFRSLRIAELKKDSKELEHITTLSIGKKKVEKNWAPFLNENLLFFEYSLNPHLILKMKDVHDPKSLNVAYSSRKWGLEWPKIWGELRGGTPPLKIQNEYLGFFHSTFRSEDKKMWYVMGAYTFEDHPPFRLTAISPYPILFKGIYESPLKICTHCIFPCGAVCEQKDGKDLIHVSCGENDTTIKVITFDQKKLLMSLKRI